MIDSVHIKFIVNVLLFAIAHKDKDQDIEYREKKTSLYCLYEQQAVLYKPYLYLFATLMI